MEKMLREANQDQLKAITAKSQYIRVIAGAGSGKTRVLTNRIIYLANEMGVVLNSILAITFTNKAANEMKSRVENVLGSNRAMISTFHSFANRLLREDIHVLNYPRSFIIIDEEEKEKVIKRLIKEGNLKDLINVKKTINFISYYKNEGVKPQVAIEDTFENTSTRLKAQVFKKYESYLQKGYYLDFDDLIIYAVKILKEFPQIRKKWQERIRYILVDEFQDTNNLQFELVKLLMDEDTSLFVVGDPDQNIYTWRGANIDIILDFNDKYPSTLDVILNQNYRSAQSILDVANLLIQNNKNRIHKDLITENKGGGATLHYEAFSTESEAQWVVDRIRELKQRNTVLKYSDFAILYRSNYYSRDIERKLINYGIRYKIYGGVRFFERREVKDLIAYLRVLVNNNDDLALERIINIPKRGIGEKTLQNARLRSEEENESLYTVFQNSTKKTTDFFKALEKAKMELNSGSANYADVLRNLLNEIGYVENLVNEEEEERVENVTSFYDYLFDYQKNNPEITLDEILQNIALYSAQDEIKDGDYVSLMTVHTAKGLEFPFVFVIGLSEGVFPAQRSIADDNKAGVEEERRLAYVAFTRAEMQLFLTNSSGFSFSLGSHGVPSRFLIETKEALTPYYRSAHAESKNEKVPSVKKKPREKSTMIETDETFRPGNSVEHIGFGSGIVISVEGEILTIAFKDSEVGVRKISKNFSGIKKV